MKMPDTIVRMHIFRPLCISPIKNSNKIRNVLFMPKKDVHYHSEHLSTNVLLKITKKPILPTNIRFVEVSNGKAVMGFVV